jgi:hypothetical protein
MTDQPAPESGNLIINKFIVTIPGQSITWYEDEDESINFKYPTAFPRSAHGYIYKASIPRDCTSEDLANYLNGLQVATFSEEIIAKLEFGYWVPIIRESPTADMVVAAFINGEYKND